MLLKLCLGIAAVTLLAGCAPSPSVIAQAVGQTQTARTPLPTLTPWPTYTPLPTLTAAPTVFVTVEVTRIIDRPVTVTPSLTPTSSPPPPSTPTATTRPHTGVSAQAIVNAFSAARLEASGAYAMKPQDFGLAPLLTQDAVRFLIPSLGADNGGRVMVFSNSQDLAVTQNYYVSLSKQSALLFSWVFTKGLVLVQINGDLPEAKANQYKSVLQAVVQ